MKKLEDISLDQYFAVESVESEEENNFSDELLNNS